MEKLIPQLRFPEFKGEWEIISLNKFCIINPKQNKLPDRFVYIDLESVNNGRLENINVIDNKNAPSRAKRLIERNDVLYQTVRPYQKNNLIYNFDNNFPYVASTGYAQLRCTDNNANFLYQIIHTDKFTLDVLDRCTGTSYPAINSNSLESIKITTPSLEEQTKIANFLAKIDKQIEILTTKKEKLEAYKKGTMQQLFNQELRFKKDDGSNFPDWEEKKLGDIFKFKQGVQVSIEKQSLIKEGNMLRFIRIIDLTTSSESPRYIYHSNLDDIIYENDLFMVRYGTPGLIGFGYTGIIANNLFKLIPKLNLINEYFKYQLEYLNSSILSLSSSTSMPAINFKSLNKLDVFYPHLDEQTKIANFLSAIDRQIEQVDKQIDKTKAFKKGLLQQMFV